MKNLRQHLDGSDRVMVLAPHPDDESLATGGVLQWAARVGAPVRVLFMTSGENNPWSQRATERRWRISWHDRHRWGARRRREALAAIAQLGIGPEVARFLEFPDQQTMDCLTTDMENSVLRLAHEFARWQPTVLFAPSLDDRHPDHGATAVLAHLALSRSPQRPRVYHYRIHPRVRSQADRRTFGLVLSAPEREAKRLAVLSHSSQLALRRRPLLEFVSSPERFEEEARPARAVQPSHPLHLVHAGLDEICLAVRLSLRILLGGVELLLITQREERTRLVRVHLAPLGTREARLSGTGDGGGGLVTSFRRGRQLFVTIASPGLRRAESVLAKLDVTRERNLGFFDAWPWLNLSLATQSHPHASRRVIEASFSLEKPRTSAWPERSAVLPRITNGEATRA